jgi:hypothetical protein
MVFLRSKPNDFGIVRAYRLPKGSTLTHDPDKAITLRDLTDSSNPSTGITSSEPGKSAAAGDKSASDKSETDGGSKDASGKSAPTDKQEINTVAGSRKGPGWGPFSNGSAFSLADWYWQSKNKSLQDFQNLINIFKQPDFTITDTIDVDWKAAFKALGANREDLPDHDAEWIKDDGWEKTPVTIDVPFHNRMRNPGLDSFVAGTFYHRKLVSVIKEKIANSKDSRSFHYQPYKATWKPKVPGARQLELYGELYSSCAFREADKGVQALPTTPRNEGLERVVVAMMFWSDGTQLTSFGGSSLWPCYLFFGNKSKYRRCRPSEHLGEQVAYFIKVRDPPPTYRLLPGYTMCLT